MTTFYRDNAVYVGSAEFQVKDQAYRLEDLELVWHKRGPRGAPGVALILGRFVLVMAVLGIIAGAGAAMRDVDISGYDSTTVLVGAVVGVVLAGIVGLFLVEGVITLIERSYEKGGAEHQIWARHLNTEVLLFATRDKLRFGKIYRALQRAIEHSDAA
jgi:Family of unknown function (DUF6232)